MPRAELTRAHDCPLFEEWAEHRFAAANLERVAARTGAGWAAIYGRCLSWTALTGDVIPTRGLRVALTGDHGALEADIFLSA